jgi:hypothetical protein
VLLEAGPAVIPRVGDQGRAQRVGLDLPKHHQHVLIVLDHRDAESALPDMPRRMLALVLLPGLCRGQLLDYPADRPTGIRLDAEIEMVLIRQ